MGSNEVPLLVSHGTFAPGLHGVMDMLMGPRENILSYSMEDGVGAAEYRENLSKEFLSLLLLTTGCRSWNIISGSSLLPLDLLAKKVAFPYRCFEWRQSSHGSGALLIDDGHKW